MKVFGFEYRSIGSIILFFIIATIISYPLVALTIVIAESRPEEKEMMISVIMNCML